MHKYWDICAIRAASLDLNPDDPSLWLAEYEHITKKTRIAWHQLSSLAKLMRSSTLASNHTSRYTVNAKF